MTAPAVHPKFSFPIYDSVGIETGAVSPNFIVNFSVVFWAVFVAMEFVAAWSHEHVMHGWLWKYHQSHHQARKNVFERNDIFAVVFALPSIVLIAAGTFVSPYFLAAGLGMTAYGAAYFVLHDVFVHRRIAHNFRPTNPYLRRLLIAHRLHHAVSTKENCKFFGFLIPPSDRQIRRPNNKDGKGALEPALDCIQHN